MYVSCRGGSINTFSASGYNLSRSVCVVAFTLCSSICPGCIYQLRVNGCFLPTLVCLHRTAAPSSVITQTNNYFVIHVAGKYCILRGTTLILPFRVSLQLLGSSPTHLPELSAVSCSVGKVGAQFGKEKSLILLHRFLIFSLNKAVSHGSFSVVLNKRRTLLRQTPVCQSCCTVEIQILWVFEIQYSYFLLFHFLFFYFFFCDHIFLQETHLVPTMLFLAGRQIL